MGLRETGCGPRRSSHGAPPRRSDESYFMNEGLGERHLEACGEASRPTAWSTRPYISQLYLPARARIGQTAIFLAEREGWRRPTGAVAPVPVVCVKFNCWGRPSAP